MGRYQQVGPTPRQQGRKTDAAAVTPQPRGLLEQQRSLGNQALLARLAPRRSGLVLHAPDSPMEREADRVAAAVEADGPRPEVTRAGAGLARAVSPGLGDMSSGIDPGEGFAARLAARRGSGQGLANGPRARLESRLGVDLGDVRVHRDPAAAGLCRDLRAEAFTHGRDIFFAEGRYAPGTAGGARLLSHEVTHTIQQRGQATSTAVQGLIRRADFVSLAGGESAWGWVKHSNFHGVLAAIDAYHTARDTKARNAALDEVIRIGKVWKAAHSDYERRSGDTRRMQYMGGLIAEAESERSGKAVPRSVTTPSSIITSRTQRGDTIEQAANAATKTRGHKYSFVVRALINHRLYGRFALRRAEMKRDNLMKVGKWRKTNAELKAAAAREVVLADDPTLADAKKKTDLADKADTLASSGVGHTWVVFVERDASDREVDRKSFGLYPSIALGQAPLEARPGDVHHPDGHDAQGGNIHERAWDIGFTRYKEGLVAAGGWVRSPPDYTLASCNCTYFAQMVGGAVGVEIPRAYFTLPNFTNLYNPNTLHDSLA